MDLTASLVVGIVLIGLLWLVAYRMGRVDPRPDPFEHPYGDFPNLDEMAARACSLGGEADSASRVTINTEAIARRHNGSVTR